MYFFVPVHNLHRCLLKFVLFLASTKHHNICFAFLGVYDKLIFCQASRQIIESLHLTVFAMSAFVCILL